MTPMPRIELPLWANIILAVAAVTILGHCAWSLVTATRYKPNRNKKGTR